jgi:hypothetical protein
MWREGAWLLGLRAFRRLRARMVPSGRPGAFVSGMCPLGCRVGVRRRLPKKKKAFAFEATGTIWDEGVGIPSLPQGGSIGQPPAYLLSSAAPAPFSLVLRDPRRPGVRVGHSSRLRPLRRRAQHLGGGMAGGVRPLDRRAHRRAGAPSRRSSPATSRSLKIASSANWTEYLVHGAARPTP